MGDYPGHPGGVVVLLDASCYGKLAQSLTSQLAFTTLKHVQSIPVNSIWIKKGSCVPG